MTSSSPYLICCFAVVLLALPLMAAKNDTWVWQLASNVERFAGRIFQELAAERAEASGVVFSPFSIYIALFMLLLGARGTSAEDLRKALYLPREEEILLPSVQGVLSSMQTDKISTLEVANRVFIDRTLHLNVTFRTKGVRYFNTTIVSTNFQHNPRGAAADINKWVANFTNRNILNLLDPVRVTDETKLILVNAVYLNASWARPFDPLLTEQSAFYVDLTNSKPVQMMHMSANLLYSEVPELDCQILELKYEGSTSLIVLLPRERDGLLKLEKKLEGKQISALVQNTRRVIVSFPKTKIISKFDLNGALEQLGMKEMFSSQANLTGLSPEPSLKVCKVVHMAYITINEWGTEAAPGTEVSIRSPLMLETEETVQFKADHPFMFVLWHDPTDTPLFWGHYLSP